MYYAKESGRNNFQFFNTEINVRSLERIRLETLLRQTINRRELVVYYQPQVNIRTREIISAEALVRWNHPEQGMLEPMQFVPAAEDTGFIAAIGYSSLNHLKRLPVEKLKIDQSFVRDIVANSDDGTIINAVTLMAHTMKLKVIAEGIETMEQWELLKRLECDEGQGYFFSRPLPAEEFKELLAA